MSIDRAHQRPMRLGDVSKRDVRTQFGALCWRRRGGEVEVLLVTSRRRRRWIIPKGWPVDRATPAEAAGTEAWEEAGVEGRVSPSCLGIFSYDKELAPAEVLPCVVAVFAVKVKLLRDAFPECTQRKRKWFTLKKAAQMVDEPELAAIIAGFEPKRL